MSYTEDYMMLKSLPEKGFDEINIGDSGITVFNMGFSSGEATAQFMNREDMSIPENLSFSYPLFAPADRRSRRVILLLHGLNERSWTKYLTWAYDLARNCGSYVILFPISFHINRAPSAWKDPRLMSEAARERQKGLDRNFLSSFANAALSRRLHDDPMRFFCSGYQTSDDLTRLLTGIRNGNHPLIPVNAAVDIFAYSIGAFLAEIMMMGNPGGLFDTSRLFIFCGGSVFANMNGRSRLIMDSAAFDRVYAYYMQDFENDVKKESLYPGILSSGMLAMAFRSMIDLARFRLFREKRLRMLDGRIRSVALAGDLIIPPEGIISTLGHLFPGKKEVVKVVEFPYACSHENPFPVFDKTASHYVDESFKRIFSAAASFFA